MNLVQGLNNESLKLLQDVIDKYKFLGWVYVLGYNKTRSDVLNISLDPISANDEQISTGFNMIEDIKSAFDKRDVTVYLPTKIPIEYYKSNKVFIVYYNGAIVNPYTVNRDWVLEDNKRFNQ